jgi:predicted transposase/invertase (TIGR01784 family)
VANEENKPLSEVISVNEALKEFAAKDAGFKQYAERYEDISTDLKVRRMYAVWTEGMSALDQARVEGLDEGGNEKARKIARNLLDAGTSIEFISTMTELSVEEIEDLRKEINN